MEKITQKNKLKMEDWLCRILDTHPPLKILIFQELTADKLWTIFLKPDITISFWKNLAFYFADIIFQMVAIVYFDLTCLFKKISQNFSSNIRFQRLFFFSDLSLTLFDRFWLIG